jgi:hypothetical protein
MNTSFKSRSFKFAYWIMLIFLAGDTLDTIYRTLTGYLGEGTSFPGVETLIMPTSTDLIVFFILQLGVIYGIYLLYNLKKIGGYWLMGSNIIFILYASTLGPIAQVGFSTMAPMILIYFCIYLILSIGIPRFYSDKFE